VRTARRRGRVPGDGEGARRVFDTQGCAVEPELDPDDADWVWVFLAASWALSQLVSYFFHTQVELRFEAWRRNARTAALLAGK
jgi:hypothetical protein